jgi:hypothetical protein
MTPPPKRRTPRYRVIVYELDNNDRQTKIMATTANGFIAAAASIQDGEIDIVLGDGGPHNLQQHIALFLADQYPA